MILYPSKMPFFVKWFFPTLIYRYPVDEKQIYLTFDDGPQPEVTPWILELLRQEQINATFFCVGSQIEKYPDIFRQIIIDGHQIGIHTYHHENGWQTPVKVYKNSVEKTERIIAQYGTLSKLFRPPYGRITFKQIRFLKQFDYKIIMWSLLSGDFHAKLNPIQALAYLKRQTKPGDIIVFHDSKKAFDNLKVILPEYIADLKKQKFMFDIIR